MSLSRVLPFAAAGFCGALIMGSIPAAASGPSIPASVVEAQAAKVLAAKTGQKLPKVTCPGNLQGKVGAFINCTLVPRGSKVVYPVRVTVNSVRNGTAHFYAQVGQAKGVANKAQFCIDNAILDKATSAAQTGSELISILKSHENTILDFQKTAPSSIVVDAGALISAAQAAIKSGDPGGVTTKSISQAGTAVDAYCGQNPDGSPIGSTTTTAG